MIESQDMIQDSPSLAGAIMKLHTEFVRMKSELSEAQTEIVQLRQQLAKQPRRPLRSKRNALAEMDLSALRRQVAYYCHPDRAGNSQLMSNINNLFDLLETFKQAG